MTDLYIEFNLYKHIKYTNNSVQEYLKRDFEGLFFGQMKWLSS